MADLKGVTGGDEIARALAEFPLQMEVNLTRGGLRAGAVIIADDAKSRVPVQSGALRDSIRVKTGKKRDGKVFAYVVAGSRTTKKTVSASSTRASGIKVTYQNPWYAHLVEFGTARHYIKAVTAKVLNLRPNSRASSGFAKRWTTWVVEGVDHPGAAPKPFLRPALDARAGSAIDAIADYLRARIAKGK